MKVLVTGGTRGLGKSIVLRFINEGYFVYVNYCHSDSLALDLYNEYKDRVKVIKADVSNEDDVKKMFDEIDALDILVNNAGIALDNDPLSKSADEFNRVLGVNLVGTFLVTKYALGKGVKSVVNISSRNAVDTYYPESMDYDASKAGVISLTHNFVKYRSDVRFNVICPDWIDTDMNKDIDPLYKEKLGKFLNPVDVALKVYEVGTDINMNDQVVVVGDNSVR